MVLSFFKEFKATTCKYEKGDIYCEGCSTIKLTSFFYEDCKAVTAMTLKVIDDSQFNKEKIYNKYTSLKYFTIQTQYNVSKVIPKFIQGAQKIEKLSANSCGITSLLNDDFKEAPNLINLFLQKNKISDIAEEAFAGLKKLKYLYLDENKLGYFHNNTFNGLTALIEVSLMHNNIETLSIKLFAKNENIKSVLLYNNTKLKPDDKCCIFIDDAFGSRECNEELIAKNELEINVEYLISIINSLNIIITKNHVQNQELEKIIKDQNTTIQPKTEKNHTDKENNSNMIEYRNEPETTHLKQTILIAIGIVIGIFVTLTFVYITYCVKLRKNKRNNKNDTYNKNDIPVTSSASSHRKSNYREGTTLAQIPIKKNLQKISKPTAPPPSPTKETFSFKQPSNTEDLLYSVVVKPSKNILSTTVSENSKNLTLPTDNKDLIYATLDLPASSSNSNKIHKIEEASLYAELQHSNK